MSAAPISSDFCSPLDSQNRNAKARSPRQDVSLPMLGFDPPGVLPKRYWSLPATTPRPRFEIVTLDPECPGDAMIRLAVLRAVDQYVWAHEWTDEALYYARHISLNAERLRRDADDEQADENLALAADLEAEAHDMDTLARRVLHATALVLQDIMFTFGVDQVRVGNFSFDRDVTGNNECECLGRNPEPLRIHENRSGVCRVLVIDMEDAPEEDAEDAPEEEVEEVAQP